MGLATSSRIRESSMLGRETIEGAARKRKWEGAGDMAGDKGWLGFGWRDGQ